jgi:hypothetical protein
MCRLFRVSTVLRAAFDRSEICSVRAYRNFFSLAIALPMLASIAVGPFGAGYAQACAPPQLVVGPAVEIALQETPFNLRVGGQPGCLPAKSYLYIQGVPLGATLSAGEKGAPGNWFVDLPALEQLTIKVPQGFSGSSDVVITLFDGAGGVLAERTVTLYAKAEPHSSSVCALAVQGKVPFGHKGSNAWDAKSLARLCRNAETSAEPAKCFDRLMRGQINWGSGTIWMTSNALALCAGTRRANGTLDCFNKTVAAGQTWRSAIERCRFK